MKGVPVSTKTGSAKVKEKRTFAVSEDSLKIFLAFNIQVILIL